MLINAFGLIGIGRACAIALSKAGWNVVIAARREEQLKATQKECPTESLVVAGDVTKEEFVAKLFAEAVAKFGRLLWFSRENPAYGSI
jgi:NAD(P)-dependent dehydrogenase (short-subunit alcohol dehydrogenase family)